MRTRPVKTALITGAGSGLGREAALILAGDGVRVFVADVDLEAARRTASTVTGSGGRVTAIEADVSDAAAVGSMFEKVAGVDLDMLVHAAAILGETVFLADMDDDQWRRMMAVNLDGAFYCCRGAVRAMRETGGGRIVLFSSVAALQATPGAAHYSAAKGGVTMLAKSLASESARHNIRVNVIAPGYVATPMLDDLPEGFEDYIIKRTPLGRLGDSWEIAGLVRFLASKEADFFTGQVFSPNGGLVI